MVAVQGLITAHVTQDIVVLHARHVSNSLTLLVSSDCETLYLLIIICRLM
jgi:hypothetical protein